MLLCAENIYLPQDHKGLCLRFLLEVLYFLFHIYCKSMIYLKFIFFLCIMYGKKRYEVFSFVLFLFCFVLPPSTICWKAYTFSLKLPWYTLHSSKVSWHVGLYWTVYFVPSLNMSVKPLKPHRPDDWSSIVSFEIRLCVFPRVVLLFQNWLG